MQQRLTAAHLQDSLPQILGRGVLEQEPLRARFNRFEQHRAVVEGREQDHGRAITARAQCAQRLDAGQRGHAHVRDDHVDRRRRQLVDELAAVGGFHCDLDVEAAQHELESFAHQGLVIGKGDADDGHQEIGAVMPSTTPPPLAVETSSVPPTASIRSRMPLRPNPSRSGTIAAAIVADR